MNAPFSRGLLLATLVLGGPLGCASSAPSDVYLSCQSDEECGGDSVCFANGCGDPGKNIVVEVIPDPTAGGYAQDLEVRDLRDQQTLELPDPSVLEGQVRLLGMRTNVGYSSPVEMLITGESLLIPGVQRHQRSELVPRDGHYALPVGSGRYTVTVVAVDKTLPPVSDVREMQPGRTQNLDFLLPAATELSPLSGTVLRQEGLAADVALEVQALDEKLAPLSQSVPVQRGTGAFTLSLPTQVLLRQVLILQVVPTAAEAQVPQKLFSIDPRRALSPLLLGDYGEPVRVQGKVLGPDRLPVAGAAVSVSGTVGGGGTYRSERVFTGADGAFTLTTLPSDASANAGMTLAVVPPAPSSAGYTLRAITVPRGTSSLLPDVVCGERIKVSGTLLRPSGSQPAAGVRVTATPIDEVAGQPRPLSTFDAARATDDTGRFDLALDSGIYRLDFLPTEDLPRVSRIIAVRPPRPGTSSDPLELSAFPLSKGRHVTGQVLLAGERRARAPAPYASIRIYRVQEVEGRPSALLLAQTITLPDGSWSTTLPTR
jgi:hypothetical protein